MIFPTPTLLWVCEAQTAGLAAPPERVNASVSTKKLQELFILEQKSAIDLVTNLITEIKQTRKWHKPIDQRNTDTLLQEEAEKPDVPHRCSSLTAALMLPGSWGLLWEMSDTWRPAGPNSTRKPPAPSSLDCQPKDVQHCPGRSSTAQGGPALPREVQNSPGAQAGTWLHGYPLPAATWGGSPAPHSPTTRLFTKHQHCRSLLPKFKLLPDWNFSPLNAAVLVTDQNQIHPRITRGASWFSEIHCSPWLWIVHAGPLHTQENLNTFHSPISPGLRWRLGVSGKARWNYKKLHKFSSKAVERPQNLPWPQRHQHTMGQLPPPLQASWLQLQTLKALTRICAKTE